MFSSLLSWTLILEKILEIKKQNNRLDVFELMIGSGQAIDQIYKNANSNLNSSASKVFVAAINEIKNSHTGKQNSEILIKVQKVIDIECNKSLSSLEKNTDYIATIGSTAPFIGLFGTVWGIMNSFQTIALTKNASLAILAPNISEALFSTAAGLIVAIPAFALYNRIVSLISRFNQKLSLFANVLILTLEKELK